MIYYGKNIVDEIINSNRFEIIKIYTSSEKLFSYYNKKFSNKLDFLSKEKIANITNTTHHQNIAVKVKEFSYLSYEDFNMKNIENNKICFVMFDSIQDPQNFGAALRNCYCFGIHNVIIQNRNSVDVTAAVMKASAGAAAYINIYSVVNLSRIIDLFKEYFIPVYSLDLSAENYIHNITFKSPFLLIVGSEDKGIRHNLLKKSDTLVRIKQNNKFNSLNLSSSVAVALYETFMTKNL